jgi:hypothetical protein
VAVLATECLLTNPAVLRAARENMVAATVVDFVENFILCQKGSSEREEDRKNAFVFAAGFGWSEVSQ